MPCDEQWCPECYALSIPLPSENDKNEIEFGKPEAMEEIETTPIYLIENQPALQLKYFNNNGQGIKPKKAHEIDAGYDLRYLGKDTLVLKPKSLTKINLKIALKISPRAMIQLKELIAEFANIFAENNNDLGRTNLVQHQIYTEDAKPRRQQAYRIAPESHQFIQEEVQQMLNNELI
ncbi:hypothetical protein G9A89_003281 [Geosiphon pyriformis]|nr:hypothetical protein G9A89_003281 [Geosiphon pyriformis]